MNNSDLIEQLRLFRLGSENAFELIYKELKKPIFTIIYRITYDRSLSEDIMQELFFKLSSTPPPEYVKKPRAWIFKMARNLSIDYKRRYKESLELNEEITSQTNFLEKDAMIRIDIEEALKRLDSQDREIVTLRLNAEMKFKDMADILDQPIGTILWRYQKAVKALKKTLDGKDGYL